MLDRLAPSFRGTTAEPSEHPVPCNVHPLDEHSVPNPIMPDIEPYVECTTVYRTCHRNLLFPSLRKRTIRAPAKYNDYMPSESIIDQLVLVDNDELHTPISVTPESMPPALADFVNNNVVICTISDDTAVDPNSVKEARNSVYWNEWLGAMQEELASLKAKAVYEPVRTLPASRCAVQHKWVLHIKRDKSNAISLF
jgi:hypothetical protein